MLRKLIAGILLTTFLVATTGFVLVQCCCDTSATKECCRAKETDGCKTDVSYYKLSLDYQVPATQQLSFFSVSCDVPFAIVLRPLQDSPGYFWFDDTGPPDYYSNSQSRLQVFRI